MKLELIREVYTDSYTEGKLYIDGDYFCDTLEDKDRELTNDMTEEEIKVKKVYSKTAIPKGEYKITLDVISPKFSAYPFYMEVCKGKLPRLLNVKGFEGILIHVADGYKSADLLSGCIGIGTKNSSGTLKDGKETFKKLYAKLETNKNNLSINIK